MRGKNLHPLKRNWQTRATRIWRRKGQASKPSPQTPRGFAKRILSLSLLQQEWSEGRGGHNRVVDGQRGLCLFRKNKQGSFKYEKDYIMRLPEQDHNDFNVAEYPSLYWNPNCSILDSLQTMSPIHLELTWSREVQMRWRHQCDFYLCLCVC